MFSFSNVVSVLWLFKISTINSVNFSRNSKNVFDKELETMKKFVFINCAENCLEENCFSKSFLRLNQNWLFLVGTKPRSTHILWEKNSNILGKIQTGLHAIQMRLRIVSRWYITILNRFKLNSLIALCYASKGTYFSKSKFYGKRCVSFAFLNTRKVYRLT